MQERSSKKFRLTMQLRYTPEGLKVNSHREKQKPFPRRGLMKDNFPITNEYLRAPQCNNLPISQQNKMLKLQVTQSYSESRWLSGALRFTEKF